MFSPQVKSLALVGAAALSGCSSEVSMADDLRSSLEKATVIKQADGGVVLKLIGLSDRDRLQAIAEWRDQNPGDFVIRYGDPQHPWMSTWVKFVPVKKGS